MPLAVFVTNMEKAQVPADFAEGLSHVLGERLHRDEHMITIQIRTDEWMLRGGTTAPTGYVKLITSRGFGDIEHRRVTSQSILDYIKKKLGLNCVGRFMIYMEQRSADDIGVDGGLVSDRYGSMGQGGAFDVRWHPCTKESGTGSHPHPQ